MDFSDELLDVMANSPRIARHVHAPLQSGCDATLRRMKRRYRSRHYADRLAAAYRRMPDAAFGADVMVGFPGETDDDFEESRSFIASLPLTYLHVFTYSERPGTPAADAPHPVPIRERKRRNEILRQLAAEKNREFRRRFAGRRLSVVTLDRPRSALSHNYIPVELASDRPANQILEIQIGEPTAAGLCEVEPLRILH